jgi:hypothetical protein
MRESCLASPRAAALLELTSAQRSRVSRATRRHVTKTRAGPRARFIGRFFFVTTPRRAGTLLPECGSPIV